MKFLYKVQTLLLMCVLRLQDPRIIIDLSVSGGQRDHQQILLSCIDQIFNRGGHGNAVICLYKIGDLRLCDLSCRIRASDLIYDLIDGVAKGMDMDGKLAVLLQWYHGIPHVAGIHFRHIAVQFV